MSHDINASARILVVDDDDSLRRVTDRLLTRGGHQVSTASNRREAVALCRAHSFDLLLTDIVMPDIDGQSLAEIVRPMQRGLVVLFMSGYAQGPDLAYEDGATIGKPFTAERLLRSVGEAVGFGGAAPPSGGLV